MSVTFSLKRAVVALMFLAACGCGPVTPEGPNHLVFKYGRFSGPSSLMPELMAAFERENPGVTVAAEALPSSADQQHQYYALNLEGAYAGIDVMTLDVIWTQEFARAGWIEDLTPRWPEADRRGFLAGPMAANTWSDRVWAVPWYVDAGVLYYRTDLLERHKVGVPRTLGELASAVKTILAAEHDPQLAGYVWQGKQYEGLVCAALEMVRGTGGDVLDPHGAVVLDSPATVDAVRGIRSLIESGVSPQSVLSMDEEAARIHFQRGQSVFMRNWPYAWTLFAEKGSAVRGKVGVAPVPGGAATLGGWQLAVNRFSRKKDLAFRLVQYMARPDVMKRLALEAGLKPPRRALYHDPELVAAQPFITGLLPALEGARPRPTTPYYVMISQDLQLEFSAAVAGIRTPQEAMGRAATRIRRLLTIDSDEKAASSRP